jgi:hypothetical protein
VSQYGVHTRLPQVGAGRVLGVSGNVRVDEYGVFKVSNLGLLAHMRTPIRPPAAMA